MISGKDDLKYVSVIVLSIFMAMIVMIVDHELAEGRDCILVT